MSNIVLYGNGGAGNHGCEAIVRGTVSLLGKNNKYIISSIAPIEDTRYGLGEISYITSAKSKSPKNFHFLYAYLRTKMFHSYEELDGLAYQHGIKEYAGKAGVALSIGGDNYCYKGTEIYPYLNRAYHRAGINTILWGCSVEPNICAGADIRKDMQLYDAIVARESISYAALREINSHTILAPDPAFHMAPQACKIEEAFDTADVIGINLSPMIMSNEKKGGITIENYRRLIEWILKETNYSVALIPHVVWKTNDDREVLRLLHNEFEQSGRVFQIEDHSAPELKYIISRCKMFIGARTHATIAAYSTCVPTLAVGYSVKARGIAKDLFGDVDHYVIPVQKLECENDLINAFRWMHDNRISIREHLTSFIPEYIKRGQDAIMVIEGML